MVLKYIPKYIKPNEQAAKDANTVVHDGLKIVIIFSSFYPSNSIYKAFIFLTKAFSINK